MADIISELLGSELSLMFFISLIVWGLILLYIYYTNLKLKNLEREVALLKDD